MNVFSVDSFTEQSRISSQVLRTESQSHNNNMPPMQNNFNCFNYVFDMSKISEYEYKNVIFIANQEKIKIFLHEIRLYLSINMLNSHHSIFLSENKSAQQNLNKLRNSAYAYLVKIAKTVLIEFPHLSEIGLDYLIFLIHNYCNKLYAYHRNDLIDRSTSVIETIFKEGKRRTKASGATNQTKNRNEKQNEMQEAPSNYQLQPQKMHTPQKLPIRKQLINQPQQYVSSETIQQPQQNLNYIIPAQSPVTPFIAHQMQPLHQLTNITLPHLNEINFGNKEFENQQQSAFANTISFNNNKKYATVPFLASFSCAPVNSSSVYLTPNQSPVFVSNASNAVNNIQKNGYDYYNINNGIDQQSTIIPSNIDDLNVGKQLDDTTSATNLRKRSASLAVKENNNENADSDTRVKIAKNILSNADVNIAESNSSIRLSYGECSTTQNRETPTVNILVELNSSINDIAKENERNKIKSNAPTKTNCLYTREYNAQMNGITKENESGELLSIRSTAQIKTDCLSTETAATLIVYKNTPVNSLEEKKTEKVINECNTFGETSRCSIDDMLKESAINQKNVSEDIDCIDITGDDYSDFKYDPNIICIDDDEDEFAGELRNESEIKNKKQMFVSFFALIFFFVLFSIFKLV